MKISFRSQAAKYENWMNVIFKLQNVGISFRSSFFHIELMHVFAGCALVWSSNVYFVFKMLMLKHDVLLNSDELLTLIRLRAVVSPPMLSLILRMGLKLRWRVSTGVSPQSVSQSAKSVVVVKPYVVVSIWHDYDIRAGMRSARARIV